KDPAELIRESVLRMNPEDAYNELLVHREIEDAKVYRRLGASGLRILNPAEFRYRSAISAGKRPMLDAAMAVLEQYRAYWPLPLRHIHYRLLTRAVLRHARKPKSLYVNSLESYKDLSKLLVRARLDGDVPWESMHDPTRPRTTWRQWDDIGEYMH